MNFHSSQLFQIKLNPKISQLNWNYGWYKIYDDKLKIYQKFNRVGLDRWAVIFSVPRKVDSKIYVPKLIAYCNIYVVSIPQCRLFKK